MTPATPRPLDRTRGSMPRATFLPKLLGCILIASVLAGCDGAPDPAAIVPAYDSSSLEPRVAAKLARVEYDLASEPHSVAAWGRLGMVFQAHALYPQAVACYRQAVGEDDRDYRWKYLAALALSGSDLDAAVVEFDGAVALSPPNESVYLAAADAYSQRGSSQRAAELCRDALSVAPGSPHANLCLGRLAVASGDLDLARRHLVAAVTSAPRLGEAHRWLATVYRRQQNVQQAADHEELARAFPTPLRPRDPVVEAMRAEAVNSRSYTERGRKLAERGRYPEAERQFREVLKIRAPNVRDLTNLGGALAGQSRFDEALELFEQALELDPDDAVAHNNLGLALAGLGRLDEAAAALESAIAADPEYAEAVHNLGLLEARNDQPEDAVAKFRRALEIDPGLIAARTDLAVELERLGRRDQAIEALATAVELDPHDPAPRYALALALIQAGRHGDALAHLRRGLELAPNSSRFASLLAWELATAPDPGSRDAETAVELARRMRDAYPQEPSALDVLAAALAERGDFSAAAETATEATRLAAESGRSELAAEIGQRVELYRAGRAFRQPRPAGSQPEPGS